MSDIAICAHSLNKVFRIGLNEQRHETLFSAAAAFLRSPINNFKKLRKLTTFDLEGQEEDVLWALKDVSFEVRRGAVLGIIGRNGAGKSTLLKILSRITEPTSGRIEVYGRVASLLEVGTGFHPDLTGRENIYLNGTILGMRKKEIDRKFDEIVEFSEVGRFIDTPVKRYSSGMRVRLAFSVAAHLEPEILVIDEVLAVGDASFQKKCMGKMGDVASQGRTVLFVSHNMAAVKALCTEGLVLKNGQVAFRGESEDAIAAYLAAKPSEEDGNLAEAKGREGSGPIRFTRFNVFDHLGQSTDLLQSGQRITLELNYASTSDEKCPSGLAFHIFFTTAMEERLFICSTQFAGDSPEVFPTTGAVRCSLPCLPLLPVQYSLEIACVVTGRKVTMDRIVNAKVLTVIEGDFFGSGKLPPAYVGPFLVPHSWEVIDERVATANAV
jgi:homopolymeric O-antigen transport system ATP-binding protein